MQDQLLQLLGGRRGHFQMESGYHSDQWFELGALLDQRERLQPFVSALAQRLAAHRVDAVCGPMTGGARLAEMIAREIGVAYLYTERFETAAAGLFPVRYELPAALRAQAQGRTVAIVDDAISAGSAVRGTFTDLVAAGARPVALGALFVFGDAAARFAAEQRVALEGIAHLAFGMWPPVECPLCRAQLPLEKVSEA